MAPSKLLFRVQIKKLSTYLWVPKTRETSFGFWKWHTAVWQKKIVVYLDKGLCKIGLKKLENRLKRSAQDHWTERDKSDDDGFLTCKDKSYYTLSVQHFLTKNWKQDRVDIKVE